MCMKPAPISGADTLVAALRKWATKYFLLAPSPPFLGHFVFLLATPKLFYCSPSEVE